MISSNHAIAGESPAHPQKNVANFLAKLIDLWLASLHRVRIRLE